MDGSFKKQYCPKEALAVGQIIILEPEKVDGGKIQAMIMKVITKTIKDKFCEHMNLSNKNV